MPPAAAAGPGRLLVLGGVDYGPVPPKTKGWGTLPGSEAERELVAERAGRRKVRALTGTEATWSRLKRARR